MKKKFAIGGVFLLTYIVFLIATLPTTLVLNQVSLPKNIQLSGVSGSIWDTSIAQANIEGNNVQQVNARLSFLSLLTLTPKLDITFGDELIAGPEGELVLTLSQDKAKIDNLKLLLKANNIAQQLDLPLPMTARGDVELTLLTAEIDLTKNNQCIIANGTVTWSKAGINALEQNVKLGKLNADIGCENGALAVVISPKNDLGLTFTAYVQPKGKMSGNGYLKPGAKFPKALNDALPFLGRKDNQGRYRLKF